MMECRKKTAKNKTCRSFDCLQINGEILSAVNFNSIGSAITGADVDKSIS